MLTNTGLLGSDGDGTLPPSVIRHREAERTRLGKLVQPDTADGHVDGFVVITGPPGSGKTRIAKHVIRKRTPRDARIAHVHCWECQGCNDALYSTVEQLHPEYPTHRNATSRATVVERLTSEADAPRYVILDEADQLRDTEFLYDLDSAPNTYTVVIVQSSEDLREAIDPRTWSRIRGAADVHFDAYSQAELLDILQARVEVALEDDPVEKRQLEHIAACADGDARCAIDTLREAAKRAMQAGRDAILDSDIEAVSPKDSDADATAACPPTPEDGDVDLETSLRDVVEVHRAVLYRIIVHAGEIGSGELYEQYAECMGESARSRRQVRDYLSQISDANLIVKRGSGVNTRWEAVGGGIGSGGGDSDGDSDGEGDHDTDAPDGILGEV